jgi:hypothetical protein
MNIWIRRRKYILSTVWMSRARKMCADLKLILMGNKVHSIGQQNVNSMHMCETWFKSHSDAFGWSWHDLRFVSFISIWHRNLTCCWILKTLYSFCLEGRRWSGLRFGGLPPVNITYILPKFPNGDCWILLFCLNQPMFWDQLSSTLVPTYRLRAIGSGVCFGSHLFLF